MIVFIDESGDTGRRINEGSSKFFVVTMVLFNDYDEAKRCDERINLLKSEIGKDESFEFHFNSNSDKVRRKLLEATIPYEFTYFSVAINKNPERLYGEGFNNKESFYKYACNMVITNAYQYLNNAIVVLDKSGSPNFRRSLTKYLKLKFNSENGVSIKKLKQQRSESNNLIQLADYICGVVNRKVQDKKYWMDYYKYISMKEMSLQMWPK